ncbi:MAG: MaoC family dehydratase N-terminal domain-containing protein [Candidatus Rokubacteria bacterium]|nr:MaoC family dehydratase N-terminal domain-containing protein [Candidatus Rokubacteria bacterium]
MKYAKVYFEDVEVGAEMPPLVKGPIQQIQLTRYAGASGDFNPIHQDPAFARAAGMGNVFAHGMLSMGFVAQSVTDWLGVGAVQKIGVRFAGLVRLGDLITCRGKIVAKRPAKEAGRGQGVVDLELRAENQRGEKVITGKATVALLCREES